MSSEAVGQRQERLSRPHLYMGIAQLFARRGTCLRAEVGALAVIDHRVVAGGYVGAPAGMPHCLDVGCDIRDGHCVRSIHAEANMVSWAARTGTVLQGASIWCTLAPCVTCAKLLINLEPKEVVYESAYGDGHGIDLLMNMDIPVVPFEIIADP